MMKKLVFGRNAEPPIVKQRLSYSAFMWVMGDPFRVLGSCGY